MPNMKSKIQSHNRRILSNNKKTNTTILCNCREKNTCPLNGKCKIANVIYEAKVITKDSEKKYIGSTGGEFKSRFYGHTSSFKHEEKKSATELSKHIWSLKEQNNTYKIKWKILEKISESDGTIRKNSYCPRKKKTRLIK